MVVCGSCAPLMTASGRYSDCSLSCAISDSRSRSGSTRGFVAVMARSADAAAHGRVLGDRRVVLPLVGKGERLFLVPRGQEQGTIPSEHGVRRVHAVEPDGDHAVL